MKRYFVLAVIAAMAFFSAGAAVDQAKINAVMKGELKEAKASWWGFDPADSTKILQAAINSKVPRLIIDKQATPWMTEPLQAVSNQELVFEDGAELQAKRGSYKDRLDSVISFIKTENTAITGLGKGGIIRMHKKDYQNKKLYSHSEWRHCIFTRHVKNFRVENMQLCSSGGDGIELYRFDNVLLKNVVCDDNHRQGLSVLTGRNLLVENCKFTNTRGTSPQAGVDIEPFEPKTSELRNIVFRNCLFANNATWGVLLAISSSYFDSKYCGEMDIRFENCKMVDNEISEIYMFTNHLKQQQEVTAGKVEFVDCIAENTRKYDYWRPAVEFNFDLHHKVNVLLKNLTVTRGVNKEKAMRFHFKTPHTVGITPQSKIRLDNVKLTDTAGREMFDVFDASFSGAADCISGNIIDKNGKNITLDEKFVQKFMTRKSPEIIRDLAKKSMKVAAPAKEAMESYPAFYFHNDVTFWFRAKAGQQVKFVLEYSKTDLSKDSKVTLLDTTGKSTELGVIKPGENKTFRFTAGAEGIYQVKMAALDLLVAMLKSNVPAGVMPRDIAQNVRTSTGTLYFFVPKGTPDFAVRVWSGAFGKWHGGVGVKICDPRGKEVYSSKNALNGATYIAPAALAKKGGIWSITFSAPKGNKKYVFWDYNFRILGASPYVGLRADRTPELQ